MHKPPRQDDKSADPVRPDEATPEISDLQIFQQLHLLKRLINQAMVGNDHAQARILALINRRETIDQQELMRIYPVKASSMSQFLFKLERQGLITRPRRPSDQRRRNVEITPAGRAEAISRESSYQDDLDKLFCCLTSEERRSFMAILVKICDRYLATLNHGEFDGEL